MKSRILAGLLVAFALHLPVQAQQASYYDKTQDQLVDAALTVISPDRGAWVAVIPDSYAGGFQYGWWDAWHALKDAGNYVWAPFTFRHLPPGGYTLVVYDPSTQNMQNIPEGASDGVVIEKINLQPGQQHFFIFTDADFVDWNCLSCPWLYVYDGEDYVRTAEILKDVVGASSKTTTVFTMNAEAILEGRVRVRIQEEKDEITYLDGLTLVVDGQRLQAQVDGQVKAELLAHDGDYVVLHKGDAIDIEFTLPEGVTSTDTIQLEAHGYYEPDQSMLDAVVGNRFVSVPVGR